MEPKTLREIIKDHPDWADLPVVVYNGDGYEWIGCSGMVYTSKACPYDGGTKPEDATCYDGCEKCPYAEPVVVFAGN